MPRNKKKSVAILLATYNGASFLEAQLLSLCAQKENDFTIYYRDDGSTDATEAIISKFSQKLDIKAIRDNLGGSGSPAANFIRILLTVNLDDHDFFAFCDQDDIWDPDKLAVAISRLAEGNDGYSSNLLAFDNSRLKSWYVKKSQKPKEFDYLFQGASAGCTYVFSAKLAKLAATALRKLNNEQIVKLSHDWALYAIARNANLNWHLDESSYIFYRQHSANIYGDGNIIQKLIKKASLIRNGWYPDNIRTLTNYLNFNQAESELIKNITSKNPLKRLSIANKTLQLRRRNRESISLYICIILGLI